MKKWSEIQSKLTTIWMRISQKVLKSGSQDKDTMNKPSHISESKLQRPMSPSLSIPKCLLRQLPKIWQLRQKKNTYDYLMFLFWKLVTISLKINFVDWLLLVKVPRFFPSNRLLLFLCLWISLKIWPVFLRSECLWTLLPYSSKFQFWFSSSPQVSPFTEADSALPELRKRTTALCSKLQYRFRTYRHREIWKLPPWETWTKLRDTRKLLLG